MRKHLTDVARPGSDALTKPDADANTNTGSNSDPDAHAITDTDAGEREHHSLTESGGRDATGRHRGLRFEQAVPLEVGPERHEQWFQCRDLHPAHQLLQWRPGELTGHFGDGATRSDTHARDELVQRE